jgi:hypothetical protein
VPVVQPPGLHPWHDFPTGPNPPDQVTAVIEIPTNERNKYELDKKLGVFRLDRVLHSAVHYPGDYGFLPRTLGDDGDPLDWATSPSTTSRRSSTSSGSTRTWKALTQTRGFEGAAAAKAAITRAMVTYQDRFAK